MSQLSYSALDLAVILCKRDLGIQEEMQFLLEFWQTKRGFLEWKYQCNKRRFLQDVQYWICYINDKDGLDAEFITIVKDAQYHTYDMEAADHWNDLDEIDILFKDMYIQMNFFEKKRYIRKSMRQLLKKYHLRKRTAKIVEKMEQYIRFYGFKLIVNRKQISDITKIPLDQPITFRL